MRSNLSYSKLENSGEGMFGFEEGDKFGYMDVTGKIIIPAAYSYENTNYKSMPTFKNGLAAVRKDGKTGIIDKKGTVLIPFEYETLINYSNSKNFAVATKKEGSNAEFLY